MPTARIRAMVDGDVQGVGYRYNIARTARRLRLTGQVTNTEDGRVQIIAEGEEERIKEFIQAIDVKKPPITVENIEVLQEKPTGEFKAFRVVTGDLAEEIVEGFSTGAAYFSVMFDKQDSSLDKQDQMLGKQDQMLNNQDQMLRIQEKMLGKQDEMVSELKELRIDLRSFLDQRLGKIEQEIGEIKNKLGMI